MDAQGTILHESLIRINGGSAYRELVIVDDHRLEQLLRHERPPQAACIRLDPSLTEESLEALDILAVRVSGNGTERYYARIILMSCRDRNVFSTLIQRLRVTQPQLFTEFRIFTAVAPPAKSPALVVESAFGSAMPLNWQL